MKAYLVIVYHYISSLLYYCLILWHPLPRGPETFVTAGHGVAAAAGSTRRRGYLVYDSSVSPLEATGPGAAETWIGPDPHGTAACRLPAANQQQREAVAVEHERSRRVCGSAGGEAGNGTL